MPNNAFNDSNDSNHFFLRQIVFAPNTSQVKLTFQKNKEQQSIVEKFYPRAYFKAKTEQLNNIRNHLEKLNVRALFEQTQNGNWKVSTKDEESLQLVQREIYHVTGFNIGIVSVLEQFLIEKNYRIGQAFTYQNEEWIPVISSKLPAFFIPALDQSVERTIQEFLNDGQELPVWFKQFAYGYALQMIPENVGTNPKALVKTLLIHESFKKEQPFIIKNNLTNTKQYAWERLPQNQLQSFNEKVLQNYNVSPETIDCACCTPQAYPCTNLLPHSQVQLQANNDGTFVESFHPEFAVSFDSKHNQSAVRWNFKSDWKLQHVPIGPLSRNQTMTALLLDAQTWEESGQTKTIGLHQPHWYCMKQTGLLPQSWKNIQYFIQTSRENLGKWYQSGFQEHGLLGVEANWHNPHIAWNQLVMEAYTQLAHHFWSSVRQNGLLSNEGEQALKAAYWQWGQQTNKRKIKKAARK